MIPDAIKNKIESYAEKAEPTFVGLYNSGQYGYSLAQEEIERLKGLIEVAFKAHNIWTETGTRYPMYWQQFKQQNNL